MKIIGIGETVYDIIFRNNQPDKAVPGGSTYNAMISLGRTLGRSGVPCMMISETGDDHIGRVIADFTEKNHVSSEYITINHGTKTHISLAFLDENNDAQYEFYKDHKHADIPNHFPKVNHDDLVLFGSFFAINPVIRPMTRAFLSQAYASGATLYYDINFRRNHQADLPLVKDNIEENYKFATIVRGSADDFDFLYGTKDASYIYNRYILPHCDNFILTDGANSITVFTPEINGMSISVEPITTVSTIGAGDNFNAGFLYGMATQGTALTETNLKTIIGIAQRFAQCVCQSIYNYVDEDFAENLCALK
ncbi:MAG: PfkB family carbohydrate kinase [Bacteroidaceae bacterium]|nr:PfkB family carbohydrate kinase [Bacteroidaceae bacterium]